MGCDMHGFIEFNDRMVRFAVGGEFRFARDYQLFAALADVRNARSVPAIAAGRGVPDDCSWNTKEAVEEWGSDGHSHSWATADEYEKALAATDWEPSWENALVLTIMREVEKHATGVRLVFWFDN